LVAFVVLTNDTLAFVVLMTTFFSLLGDVTALAVMLRPGACRQFARANAPFTLPLISN